MQRALLIFVIISLIPLFKPGLYTSHDGENHLVRLAYFHKYLSEGYIVPKWISELNSGLGYPIFYFINPLPYYLGSLPKLVSFSTIDSLKIVLFVSTIIGAFGVYYWVLGLVKHRSLAFLAAVIYVFTPYRFVDVFVRLALSEIVFLAVIPWAFYRATPYTLSLLILSHTQLTVLFFPLLFIYSYLNQSVSSFLKHTLLALGLTAFFWLPSVVLISYTKFDSLVQFPPASHMPTLRQLIYSPWGFGFSHPGPADEMSFQVGVANWLSLFLGSVIVFVKKDKILGFFVLITWITIIFMFTNFFGVWDTSFTHFIQFPWRLLAIPLILTPVIVSLALSYLSSRNIALVTVFLILVAIYTNRNHITTNMPQFLLVQDKYFFQAHKTTTATPDELMPKGIFPQSHPVIAISYGISSFSVVLMLLIHLWKKKNQ